MLSFFFRKSSSLCDITLSSARISSNADRGDRLVFLFDKRGRSCDSPGMGRSLYFVSQIVCTWLIAWFISSMSHTFFMYAFRFDGSNRTAAMHAGKAVDKP